ncbi:60S ribosomal protein L12, putative [Trypanosoma brucei brucei TREU927]|uniref:60S ribosomal protein L12, putative n=1 Tax=Trypanosoma brucei brucei (strain 927/4 GUTat10.1) TaxID=185431 RepID=Q38D53_TRYB2|nr:60S ribosomal protein L12, putative [Trypanosoma brucei brucei TREU927]EAN77267.1 60S ribosomal protein L12, putative [Trypanosoma brucei brucei TREU927]
MLTFRCLLWFTASNLCPLVLSRRTRCDLHLSLSPRSSLLLLTYPFISGRENKTWKMPPKFDPNQEITVVVRAVGGEVPATASLAPKVGPLGLNAKKIGEDIAKSTKDWKGLKVTCQLRVKNRVATVIVTPSVASRLIRALKEPPRDRKKVKNIKHDGNIAFSEILKIAKESAPNSMGASMKSVVMEVLGTAVSIGCTIDGEHPRAIQEKVQEGKLKVPN